MLSPINQFLVSNGLYIKENPCISPDFCLNWEELKDSIEKGDFKRHLKSEFSSGKGNWVLIENVKGDHAWEFHGNPDDSGIQHLSEGAELGGKWYYPATYSNLIGMKNLMLENDSSCTVFPRTSEQLGKSTLGIGARFTTLHWDGVDWAMSRLGIGLTANQNSIPRELVYDVDAMLADKLDSVPFPFIGCDVPEGHQGQSVEGMSHGCVLAKLKNGFHKLGIPWSFNADHQPIGGKFDEREDQLVQGCLFASYITFDLSPELAITQVPDDAREKEEFVKGEISSDIVEATRKRVQEVGLAPTEEEFNGLLAYVWPAMVKMKTRDEKYQKIRNKHFTAEQGREYLRELSIDELPGLTTPETTAVMLALSFEMGMPIHFVAPAFGFQKNIPYPDNDKLRKMITPIWNICEKFGVSIGFHSGSGKSAENYQVAGDVTQSNLEIKTSGRYTYEMGVALYNSTDSYDQELWRDWYNFTVELASNGCFAEDPTERKMAREFVSLTVDEESAQKAFISIEDCRSVLRSLEPSPDHFFWFEYNFLYVLAAAGASDKKALGDHSAEGYKQRQRFYSISEEGRLLYVKRVAEYILFLATNTSLVDSQVCENAKAELALINSYSNFIDSISQTNTLSSEY
ncbi:MAG: hypothetical protein CMI19_03190 [Opitutae bacterium]|nr:hypothetical protein [Opitutae bacterium]|tara:strand:+ start:3787 stop:5673 length:1887 start_codon:yes stop_codon:yes gene_type:complete